MSILMRPSYKDNFWWYYFKSDYIFVLFWKTKVYSKQFQLLFIRQIFCVWSIEDEYVLLALSHSLFLSKIWKRREQRKTKGWLCVNDACLVEKN